MSTTSDARARLRVVPDEGVDEREERRPSFDVIEGLDRAARTIRVFGVTILITALIALVGVLIMQAMMIEDQGQLDAQRRAIEALEADTEVLRHELAELESPARIVTEARRLGMIDAPEVTYLRLRGSDLDERTISIAANQLRSG